MRGIKSAADRIKRSLPVKYNIRGRVRNARRGRTRGTRARGNCENEHSHDISQTHPLLHRYSCDMNRRRIRRGGWTGICPSEYEPPHTRRVAKNGLFRESAGATFGQMEPIRDIILSRTLHRDARQCGHRDATVFVASRTTAVPVPPGRYSNCTRVSDRQSRLGSESSTCAPPAVGPMEGVTAKRSRAAVDDRAGCASGRPST
jgi:hypothetical protein